MLLTFASCGPTQELISETPKTTREAIIYEDKVVIVTRTTISKDHYERLVASREKLNN
jgi:4-hydroxy-3-methylbut-2-enyl diphosphate reductase IspH